ncbi:MAG: PAS domain-containing protein [Roseburia sp.]|nr:PAS domain-containing protein [Roseburia sp.]
MEERVFQFALDRALEIVLVFGDDGKIIYANRMAKEQLEYGEDIYNRFIEDIFPNEFQTMTGSFLMKKNFEKETLDIMAYRRNQTCFPVRASFMKAQERPVQYLCLGHDSTDRQMLVKKVEQAGQEAEAAEKVKTEFVANVTHELRTPVNGILGNTLELLEDEPDEKRLQKLRMIERGCKDMHALINNILDFSKLDAGKFTIEKREFRFRDLMDYVRANHISKITEKGLDFFMTISPEIPEHIIGDELRIGQILNNLLSNACKFTSVGKISVEVVKTAQTDDRIELFFIVLDTGIGIDKEGQDKLFKSFSQVDASISRRYGGTGLGLNISKQLVELMDGNIHVQSELGKGTMFSFHIWVDVPQGENKKTPMPQQVSFTPVQSMAAFGEDHLREFGSEENSKEIKKKMTKLILCLDMENWEKAEMFMESIKQLTESAPQEIKSAVLRLKMAVQKGDYDKAVTAFETLEKELGYGEGTDK